MFLGKNLKYLRNLAGWKQSEMLDKTGTPRATQSNYENDETEPPLELLIKYSELFGVSIDDLITKDLEAETIKGKLTVVSDDSEKLGKGKLIGKPIGKLNDQKSTISQDLRITIAAGADDAFDKKNVVIPITDLSVAAGAAGSGIVNTDYVENVDAIRMPARFFKKKGTRIWVRAKGPSMQTTIYDGDYVLITFLERSEWATMANNEVYVVTDVDGTAYLKRVKNRFKQNFIVLTSDNVDKATFPNFNLQAEEINTIWRYECHLSFKAPNTNENLYKKIDAMEEQLDIIMKHMNQINPKLT